MLNHKVKLQKKLESFVNSTHHRQATHGAKFDMEPRMVLHRREVAVSEEHKEGTVQSLDLAIHEETVKVAKPA